MLKTIRRDKLKRDIAKGLYVCKCNYHFADDARYDYISDENTAYKQINLISEGNKRDYDKINLRLSDFDSQVGRAWENADGSVTLVIHSNLSYDFKKV
jgi:hypothetical protein